ncbi:MAG: TauD/TfdA family dioxygenase, partial [Alphaproteobacteria bacterium]
MKAHSRAPITGPEVWRGADIVNTGSWLHSLSDSAIVEIDDALAQAKASGHPWRDVTKQTFPLGAFGDELAVMSDELESGSGLVKLTGLPVARYSEDELRTIFYGLGSHLGTPVGQNGQRGMMRDIRDNSKNGGKRVDSAGPLRWHTDRADVVGLLCVRSARKGGVSQVASTTAIHNAMLARRPDLVDTLY